MTLGEPREAMPPFVAARFGEAIEEFAKYPVMRGSDALRGAIAAWIGRRYGFGDAIDPTHEILPCNGSREGLFYAGLVAIGRKQDHRGWGETAKKSVRPAILMCNPFYQAYLGAALAGNAEPVFLDATVATGHLPDLDQLAADPELLARTAAFYLCSPANPQGAIADAAYIRRALALARAYGFMLFLDECYSEIYSGAPPPGGLASALATPERFQNLVVFNSLSKRSNLPGLRSGFSAGDAGFLATLHEIRNLVAPQMPGPTQHVSAAVWSDEAHVVATRAAYAAKYDVCDACLDGRFAYRRPEGGFFLWLDIGAAGGSEAATLRLWKDCGVKVLPGAYLAEPGRSGINPGADYIRVALVHSPAVVREALERLIRCLA